MATDNIKKPPKNKVVKTKSKQGSRHIPSPEIRAKVRNYSALGLPHLVIAHHAGIDAKTMRKYYAMELEHGRAMERGESGGAIREAAMKVKDDPKFTGVAVLYQKLLGFREGTDITSGGERITGNDSGDMLFVDDSRLKKKNDKT